MAQKKSTATPVVSNGAAEVPRQIRQDVEEARDTYLATLTEQAKIFTNWTGHTIDTDDVDALLKFGEETACEGFVYF